LKQYSAIQPQIEHPEHPEHPKNPPANITASYCANTKQPNLMPFFPRRMKNILENSFYQ
jgi:hypothetical protein